MSYGDAETNIKGTDIANMDDYREVNKNMNVVLKICRKY